MCGMALREIAKFCDACGAPTAVPGDAAECKQLTVLFADVVRSMNIAAALGAERFREVITALVDRSTAVVQRYGGTVEFTGGTSSATSASTASQDLYGFRPSGMDHRVPGRGQDE